MEQEQKVAEQKFKAEKAGERGIQWNYGVNLLASTPYIIIYILEHNTGRETERSQVSDRCQAQPFVKKRAV